MNPKIYLVGGAVRDLLLGLSPKDRDYVVVGATEEWMLDQGFKKVGAAFPVFLHPETGEEYALARTEVKSGKGYHGFSVKFDPSVTLEDDLKRRDLTINAMALSEDQRFIDPFNGQVDLKNKVLRHTSEAFAEDPLRVLRVARFAARYGFEVAPETLALCRKIVAAGELALLSRERVWVELYKGALEKHPDLMVKVLNDTQAADAEPVSSYIGVVSHHLVKTDVEFYSKLVDESTAKFYSVFYGLRGSKNKKTLDDLRVPSDLQKLLSTVAFVDRVPLMRLGPEQILEIIDRLKLTVDSIDADFWRTVKNICRHHVDPYDFNRNLNMVEDAVHEISKIDFKSLVEQTEKPKVKEAVKTAKLTAIMKIYHA